MNLNAKAKINLALHITAKLDNCYHQLETIVTFADFGDKISLEPCETTKLKIKGEFAEKLGENNNIILDVVKRLEKHNVNDLGAEITLYKSVPVAAGMGGGSSNAATTLLGLNELWGLKLQKDEIMRIAKELGADVPMCIIEKPLLAKGIGDEIQEMPNMPKLHIVMVNPNVELKSKIVFDKLQKTDNEPLPELPTNDNTKEWIEWLQMCRNDMQDTAMQLVPEIGTCINVLEKNGAELARMTGAGASVFGLYTSEQSAQNAEKEIKIKYPNWWTKCGKTI